ncbi:hypothetical protein NMG60_11034245 [Bertholletia excelsa]
MQSPPDSPGRDSDPDTSLIQSIFSYDGNVMLAAVISLLLVILFVLLLHVYAKWFLSHARHRRRRSVSVSDVLGPTRFRHFNALTLDTDNNSSPTKGLEASAIAAIPLFVYESEDHKNGLECVICLSLFEDRDVGRVLPKCGHGFHVECIDMWLHSHPSCPVCRASVLTASECKIAEISSISDDVMDEGSSSTGEEYVLEVVVEVPNSEDNENENRVLVRSDALSESSASSSLSSLSEPVKGMLSRNASAS